MNEISFKCTKKSALDNTLSLLSNFEREKSTKPGCLTANNKFFLVECIYLYPHLNEKKVLH